MTSPDRGSEFDVSRRRLLAAAGLGVGVAVAGTSAAAGPGEAPRGSADPVATPPVAGLHLQFGADAAAQMTVSWHTLQPVRGARVILGRRDGRLEQTVAARTVSYVDGKSGQTVYAHHAKLAGLSPDTSYLYGALHEGATPQFATFRTAPRGRSAFTFTSFGDQGTPTAGREYVAPPGVTLPGPLFVNDNLGSPAAADTTLGVERVAPLFHLFNGDLCYANLAHDRVRAWWDFWTNNSRSAANRPWMPSPGNHENELGNGPIGYRAYQTYFSVPEAPGQTEVTRGLWYAFTAGSVRVVSIANDDVCYQDGGDAYVRGYSAGAQKAWLEAELAAARRNRDIDWIVVCMHQVAISCADKFNGADLGIREEWAPLFDRYGVDLVVCGHEHHYERSHPIRGAEANATLTPRVAATSTDVIDTTKGCVHMVLGGGGTSKPSNDLFFDPPQSRVITAVGAPDSKTGKRPPVYVREPAAWSAVRNAAHAYGFAAFTVDPGSRPGDATSIKVTYYDVAGADGRLAPFETFTLRRPRRD
ncbi:metallophosphoesterase family protein [Phenylobacterium sp.]|jgi:3',5'-cyclic AMP phosphodiesterase CpdA|uniref:purple acid phosphatase family protein n=1 Tax=Phenylobacterium sp. TaxID=1871053 RepID=UPI002E346F68|nr:metallophosphoesterase family protein [Phenylobacterium sp.]HEX3363734.1 metallophosphoesterase family protein [Phenylobacterium sp.]